MSKKITENDEYEKWVITFDKGKLEILRDGFSNEMGMYRMDFKEKKVKKLYLEMKKYYEKSIEN